jgi:hypothetical protein
MNRLITMVAALAAVGLESSCYPVQAYKMSTPVVKLKADPDVTLGYIEFDDNGEFFDRKELDATIDQIYALHKKSPDDGINVFVFIHGWKNNASDQSDNVAGFQYFLKEIHGYYTGQEKKAEAVQTKNMPLMGIYIGWRGASLKVAKDLTYWNRSQAAQRAGSPHMDEAIHRIIVATKQSKDGPQSNLVIIGHSFGGRVLEHVMTPTFWIRSSSGIMTRSTDVMLAIPSLSIRDFSHR